MALSLLSHARDTSISTVIHEPVALQQRSIQMGEASPFILAMQGCPTGLSKESCLIQIAFTASSKGLNLPTLLAMRSVGSIANGFRVDNLDVWAMLRDSVERKALFGQYLCPFFGLSRRLLSKTLLIPAWCSHACMVIALHMRYP